MHLLHSLASKPSQDSLLCTLVRRHQREEHQRGAIDAGDIAPKQSPRVVLRFCYAVRAFQNKNSLDLDRVGNETHHHEAGVTKCHYNTLHGQQHVRTSFYNFRCADLHAPHLNFHHENASARPYSPQLQRTKRAPYPKLQASPAPPAPSLLSPSCKISPGCPTSLKLEREVLRGAREQ